MDAKRKPNVLWAQVSDKVFLTLDLQEAEKPNVQLKNEDEHGRITFRYPHEIKIVCFVMRSGR